MYRAEKEKEKETVYVILHQMIKGIKNVHKKFKKCDVLCLFMKMRGARDTGEKKGQGMKINDN